LIQKAAEAIVLVERACAVVYRAYALKTVRITIEGTAQELASDELLQASYLGSV